MGEEKEPDLTALLIDWSKGNRAALDELIPLVEPALRRIAGAHMSGERADHVLQTEALVNEAYIRLVDQNRVQWANRAHFFAICARIMRRILIDHARRLEAGKRVDRLPRVTFTERIGEGPDEVDVEVLALHDALEELAELDPRQAAVVELRFFAGATIEETAEALGVSPATVKRDLATAQAWLHRRLE